MDLTLPFLMTFIVNFGIQGLDLDGGESGAAAARAILTLFYPDGCTRMQLVILFGVLMLVCTFFGGMFGILCAWTSATAANGMGNCLRQDAFRHVMALSVEQTDRFTTGSLITRMTNDITTFVDFVEGLLRGFIRCPAFLIGGTALLLSLDFRFGAVLVCTAPVLAALLFLILRKAIPLFTAIQMRLDRINIISQENTAGARVVKAYVREDYECGRFRAAAKNLRDVVYCAGRLMAVAPGVMTLLLNWSVIAIIAIGGGVIRSGSLNQAVGSGSAGHPEMTVGAIMAAITYVTQTFHAVLMATGLMQVFTRANASAKRISEVLAARPVIRSGDRTGETADTGAPAVEFIDVGFSYPGAASQPVLRGISFRVHRGETFAVIGATGAGKTSLVSLIPRFYDATSGEIRVNGIPVKDYKLDALRSRIGYVMQKSELFSASVRDNVRWGDPDADDAAVLDAIRTAQAGDFVSGMPDGAGSMIAEKGASLSGGQKQRLSIARALLRKPEILIFDDATSALDLETEAKLWTGMRERLKDTAFILVAQRVASVTGADRIAVIENDGTVIHCAPHEELLEISPTYREIYDSQFKQEGGLPA